MTDRGSRRTLARRPGFTLIEVIAALAIFGSALLVLVSLSAGCGRAVAAAQDREDRITRASRLLAIVTLWPRADLDRHLGERGEGEFVLVVDRRTPELYTAAVRNSAGGEAMLLATSIYRGGQP